MPKKRKRYDRVIFPPEVIIEAYRIFVEKLPEERKKSYFSMYRIDRGEESWNYEEKDEFFAEYRRGFADAILSEQHDVPGIFELNAYSYSWGIGTKMDISLPSRSEVEAVYEVFEKNVDTNKVPLPPRPSLNERVKIFIGHGKSGDWRDLKDHLHEKHGFEVIAYEVGSRAGLSIKEVLEQMLTESSFALLVFTPEDKDSQGRFHARENVIHELGLFQGRLGFRRAIAVISKEIEEFSNIHGLNQIRYSKGNIAETFGDILAAIKREFDEDDT
ncbi:MAG: hypothetical protein PWP57_122 [Candidatus Atribacteria bacterium]|nr:hypothetical protein [Candidatus Atribacteria bacterium]